MLFKRRGSRQVVNERNMSIYFRVKTLDTFSNLVAISIFYSFQYEHFRHDFESRGNLHLKRISCTVRLHGISMGMHEELPYVGESNILWRSGWNIIHLLSSVILMSFMLLIFYTVFLWNHLIKLKTLLQWHMGLPHHVRLNTINWSSSGRFKDHFHDVRT